MQQIQTGYVPDGALGAMYAGWNAANAEDENAQNLAKLFLANQREQQMLPLDVQLKQLDVAPKQYEAQLADAKMNDPDYINSVLTGYKGQMNSQDAAGKLAQALLPFKQAAEKAELQNKTANEGFNWTRNDLTDKLISGGSLDENGNFVPASQSQLGFFKNKRDQINQLLAEDPSYIQKDMLKDQQYQNQLDLQNIRSNAQLQAAQAAAEAKLKAAVEKGESDKQLLARMYKIDNGLIPATPQERLAARAILQAMVADKTAINAALGQEQFDMSGSGMPMKPAPADIARQQAEASRKAALGQPEQIKQAAEAGMTDKDKQALAWANANPTDPRAILIKKKLGVQ